MFRYSAFFELEEVSRNWGWFLILGIFLIALGILALASTWMTTLASMIMFGKLLVAGGILETLVAFGVRRSRGLLVRVVTGVLSVAVGTVLIRHPLASVAGLVLLAGLFLTTGLLRTITAAVLRYPEWEWTLLESIGSLSLAVMIWSIWPISALWVAGVLVGTCMIFRGLAWLMFARGARHVRKVIFA